MAKELRKYLGPCDGYIASVIKRMAPLTKITGDSRDVMVDPIEGHIFSRLGTLMHGEADVTARNGLLEATIASFPVRPKVLFELDSESMTDGTAQVAYIYGNDADTHRMGQIGFRNTNLPANEVLGDEFGSEQYPTGDGLEPRFKMVPLPYLTKGGASASYAMGITRCAHELARRFTAPGARGTLEGENWTYFPNAYGCPMKWNRKFNDGTGSGTTEIVRIRPWGSDPPLFPPNNLAESEVAATGGAGSPDANWTYGDLFYVSVMFEDHDGNFSAPFQPRPVSSVVTAAKGGLIEIGPGKTGAVADDTFRSYTLENIPIGPPGTKKRIILRTPKIRLDMRDGLETGEIELRPSRLLVAHVIDNNTDTALIDAAGDDEGLRSSPLVVRGDRLWTPATHYVEEFDERIAVGGSLRFNPCAIELGPTGSSSSRDLNLDDEDDNVYGSVAFMVSVDWNVDASALTLNIARYTIASGIIGGAFSISLTSAVSLQSVVDQINARVFGDNGGEWGAQIVGGMDPQIRSDFLAPTHIQIGASDVVSAGTAIASDAGTGKFKHVAIGMELKGVGGQTVPDNTFVVSKPDDNNLVVSNSVPVGTITTAHFFNDVGDDGTTTDTVYGKMRAYSASFPVVLPLQGDFYNTWSPEDKSSVFFTTSAPGINTLAPESWVLGVGSLGNRRGTSKRSGHVTGLNALRRGLVVAYSKTHRLLENRRNSGNDEDYRLYPFGPRRGRIAWGGGASGDDWVASMTQDGVWVADRDASVIISKDLWRAGSDLSDTTQGRGILQYEVSQLILAAARDDESLDYFHMHVHNNRLNIVFREDSGESFANLRCVYDFSGGIESNGVRELLKDDGQPFPWSAPLNQEVGPMGSIEGKLYTANESESLTDGGAIDQLDTGGINQGGLQTSVMTYNTASTTITASTPGDFLTKLGVGTTLSKSTQFDSGQTVLSVAEDGTTAVISAVPDAHDLSPASVSCYGTPIEGLAYMAADMGESLKDKIQVQHITALYQATTIIAALRIARDLARSSNVEIELPATTNDEVVRLAVPLERQSPGDVLEIAARLRTYDTTPAELWGVEAVIERLRTF